MSDKRLDAILNQSLDQIMSDRFGRYSKYIIQGRALPDVRDGLKPVQRRILFAMSELGLNWNTPYKKSARVVGEVIGKYHPHGDSSIYEAMVRMAQDWKMNVPLIDMHGNKGSIDDDPAAAMRYTEARLSKAATGILNNIKKETVSFIPNFDDSEKEPIVLPGLMPNLMVNGAKGIAAGYATEMPPHNLGEIIDAIIYKIKSPNARLDSLTSIVLGPDFPTGGIVQGADGIFQAFERGFGKIVIRSKYEIIKIKGGEAIHITEIPYGVIKQKLVKDIDEIRFNKKISGIKEVRDETDRNGLSIMIELHADTNAQLVVNYLLQKTELQVYYNYNNITIVDNAPKQLGLIELIDAYLKHQKEVQKKAIKFDLAKDEIRLEIVEGLIKVALITDEVIETIKKAEGSKQGVIRDLIAKYNFTELQANAIAELRLYRLSKTDQSIYISEAAELKVKIAYFKELLQNEESFDKYLIEILREFKKEFATPRKTVVEALFEKVEVNMEELIKHEDVYIGISRQGYIKRISNRGFESNKLEDYSLKDQDTLVYLNKINTVDKLLIFTDKGRYTFLPTHLIPDGKFKDFGKHVNDFSNMDVDENIIDVISVNDFNLNFNLVLVTSNGRVKRTKLSDFEVSRFSKAMTCFNLDDNSKLVSVRPSNGFNQIILVTSAGRAVKYSETQIPLYGTKSNGVRGIQIIDNSVVTALAVANVDDVIGLISKRGGAKRIKVSSIQPSARTTQGKQLYREVKGNPHIAIDAMVVDTNTQMQFNDLSEKLQIFEFKIVDITSIEEGFSIITSKTAVDGKILKTERLISSSELLVNIDKQSADDKIKAAEEAIEAASQISIEDILKKL